MARNKRRWGGKLGGDHSTVIDAAWLFLPDMIKNPAIGKISPGFITAGKSPNGRNAIKIIEDRGCILLSIRGSSAHQEIRVFGNDLKLVKVAVEEAARAAKFHITFGTRA